MHPLTTVSILIALGFNGPSQGFGRQMHPDLSANEFRIPVFAHKETRPDPQNDLSRVSYEWAKLWMAKDLKQVVELYADDGVFLTGSGDRLTGKAVIRDLFRKALETNTSNISVRSVRTEVSGDLAYDSGDYRETITPVAGGAKLELQGNYLIVFRKQNDGKWLIVEHVWKDKPINSKQVALSQVKLEGQWQGTLDAGAARLRLLLHVIRKDDVLSATLDSPDQGATGLGIDTISVVEGRVDFEMKALRAIYEGKLTKDGSQIEGEWNQQGQRFPLTFKRTGESEMGRSALKLQKVDVGGYGLNLLIGGEGMPAVILEGGFGAGIASWSTVQTGIAAFARTISYDRAGIGQSDLGPKPRSAKQIATELHTALEKLGVKPPYVLVGHSLGGLLVRVFTDLYPGEVAGIVLIDPSQEAFYEWTKTHPVPAFKEAEAQITKAPEGLRAEWGALEVTYAQARAAKVPNGIPVTLLSATKDEGMPEEARRVWIEKQKEWLSKVPGAKHIITEKSGHFIQAQEPGLVVNAIREVVDQSRKQKPR